MPAQLPVGQAPGSPGAVTRSARLASLHRAPCWLLLLLLLLSYYTRVNLHYIPPPLHCAVRRVLCERFGRELDRRTCTMEAQATTSNFEAIRALHLADKSLGADKLIAKLKQQRPDLKVCASEVRTTLRSLRKQAKEEAAAAEARTIALREALLGAGPSSGAGQSSSSGPSQS